jgi:hypothetical protein
MIVDERYVDSDSSLGKRMWCDTLAGGLLSFVALSR